MFPFLCTFFWSELTSWKLTEMAKGMVDTIPVHHLRERRRWRLGAKGCRDIRAGLQEDGWRQQRKCDWGPRAEGGREDGPSCRDWRCWQGSWQLYPASCPPSIQATTSKSFCSGRGCAHGGGVWWFLHALTVLFSFSVFLWWPLKVGLGLLKFQRLNIHFEGQWVPEILWAKRVQQLLPTTGDCISVAKQEMETKNNKAPPFVGFNVWSAELEKAPPDKTGKKQVLEPWVCYKNVYFIAMHKSENWHFKATNSACGMLTSYWPKRSLGIS